MKNQKEANQNTTKQYKQNLCIKGKQAPIICQNECCQKYPFVCLNEECQCRNEHKKCVKAQAKSLIQALTGKIVSLKSLGDRIQKLIQKVIDDLSDFRDHLLIDIEQKYSFFGLSEVQKLFMNSLKTGQVKQIHGKQTWQILVNLKKQEEVVKMISSVEKDIEGIINNFDSQIKKFKISIQRQLNSFDKKFQSLFSGSKVLKNPDDSRRIEMFFDKNKIKSATLLFRASENGFEAAKFHQKCDNNQHTLTIIETQFGKIIGGYTGASWNSSNSWIIDQNGSSFIFSLTNNDKFVLDNKNNSIYGHTSYGSTFGSGHDIVIYNKGNENSSSYCNINHGYYNSNYNLGDKKSWQSFSGGQGSYNFKTKQWEVWKLQLTE